MICSFTILWLFFDLATLSLAGATPWSASVPQSCWSRCCVSAPCTVLLLLVLCVCVPCPWSCFWLTGVTKGRPQHRAMSKVQLRNKSWPRRAHTVCTHSGVSGIMRAASKDISLHGALHYPWISAKSKNFLEQLLPINTSTFPTASFSSWNWGQWGVHCPASNCERNPPKQCSWRETSRFERITMWSCLQGTICAHQAHTNMMCTLRCTEVEHLAGSVGSSVERFSRARTLTWRPVGPRHTVFPTMKVLGWPAVYMWVYLVIFVCVSSMSVW